MINITSTKVKQRTKALATQNKESFKVNQKVLNILFP
jgi:hypothetical protein